MDKNKSRIKTNFYLADKMRKNRSPQERNKLSLELAERRGSWLVYDSVDRADNIFRANIQDCIDPHHTQNYKQVSLGVREILKRFSEKGYFVSLEITYGDLLNLVNDTNLGNDASVALNLCHSVYELSEALL